MYKTNERKIRADRASEISADGGGKIERSQITQMLISHVWCKELGFFMFH